MVFLNLKQNSFKKNDTNRSHPCLIYASNGTMKTSFAKTFKNLCESEVEKLKNEITHKEPEYDVKIRTDGTAQMTKLELEDFQKKFFVIESEPTQYNFNNISKLLINNELKRDYENVYNVINNSQEKLIKELAES